MTTVQMTLKEAIGPEGLIIDGDWVESKDQDPRGDVRLIQLADIGDGEYLNRSARFLTSEKARDLRCTALHPGDVLISRMADPIGRACVFPGDPKPCVTVVDICIARPDGRYVIAEWLKYAINEHRFRAAVESRAIGATRPRISGKNLQGITLFVPPIDAQRRIVGFLSRAENVLRMRRKADRKAKEIIPALFVKLFGNPRENPNAYNLVPLGDVLAGIEGGKNVQAGHIGESPYRILKISAVTSGEYDESQAKPAPSAYSPPRHYFVRDGDVLFSRANTEELVGATAMVQYTDGNSLLPDKLWRLVWRKELVTPKYLVALLQSRSTRLALSKISSGTGGSMKNIAQSRLMNLQVPIAPLDQQISFEQQAASSAHIQRLAGAATQAAERAYNSLLNLAFSPQGRHCNTVVITA